MKYAVIALVALSLTACATPPRFLANAMNAQDQCQSYGKGPNYKRPDWCWRGNSTAVVVNRVGPNAYSVYTTR